jgi:hypothetical protein
LNVDEKNMRISLSSSTLCFLRLPLGCVVDAWCVALVMDRCALPLSTPEAISKTKPVTE